MATIRNESDLRLQATSPRIVSAFTPLSGSALVFTKTKNLTTILPASITLTADLAEFTSPTVLWEYSVPSAPTVWTTIGAGSTTGVFPTKINTLTITSANFITHKGTDTKVLYRSTVSQTTWEPVVNTIEVLYSAIPDDPHVILFSRETVGLPTTTLDVVTYTNSGLTIGVSTGSTVLAYGASGANTYDVSAAVTSGTVTVGTPSTASNLRTYPDLAGLPAGLTNTAEITYTITVRNSESQVSTYTKKQFVSKLYGGASTTLVYLNVEQPTIIKQSVSAAINGSHSTTLVRGYSKSGTSVPALFGWVTTQLGAGSEGARIASSSMTATTLADSAGVSDVTFRLYDAASAGNLVDIEVVPILFKNSSNIAVNLSNDATSIPTDAAFANGVYTNTGTEIRVYQGTNELTYDAVGTSNGTWKIASAVGTGITASASFTDSGTYATVGNHSAISAATAIVTYTISGTDLVGTAFTVTKLQGFARAPAGATGTTGTAGAAGADGTKAITISCFFWGNAGTPSVPSQAFTLTWPSSVSAYPSGWTSSAGTAPGTGYVLYMLSITLTASATSPTTAANWSSGTIGSIGYRTDGSIGPQGGSARIAYVVNTSPSVPGAVTPGSGDVVPTSGAGTWSFTATSTLAAGEYMYQVDGIYTAGGNIAWGNPYLSNLKVGSLSALTANLGTVGISTVGALATTSKTYANGTAGFFLGYDSSAYKFELFNTSTSYLRWDGANLAIATALPTGGGTNVTAFGFGTTFDVRTGMLVDASPTDTSNTHYAALTGNCNFNSNVSPLGIRIGVYGNSSVGNPIGSSGYGVGVYGNGYSYGVVGSNSGTSASSGGVWGLSYQVNSPGVYATNSTAGGVGIEISGDRTFKWNSQNIAAPASGQTTFLQRDGTWQIATKSIIGTAPVSVSGGSTATATVSMSAASSGVNGYMTGTYATKLDGIATGATANTGTVTSVSGSGGSTGLTLTGGAITTSGTLTLGGTLAVANGGTGGTTQATARSGIDAQIYDANTIRVAADPGGLGTTILGFIGIQLVTGGTIVRVPAYN